MLLRRRHHWPLSVSGPKSAPKEMACCGVGSKAETPRSTMMANTKTLAAMRATVMGNEAGESASGSGGSKARVDCASCWTQAGQLREEDESPKSRSNAFPQVAQRS